MVVESGFIGAEWRLPSISRLLDVSFILPIVIYFCIFQAIAHLIRLFTWNNYPAFERYRLQNLSVSLIHSIVSGGCAFVFMICNTFIMFNDTLHWYDERAAQLPLLSMGYFCHDTIDIFYHEPLRDALQILLHHIVILFVFSIGLLSHKFLPYAYWALLVEISSVFIHIRAILEISMLCTRYPHFYHLSRLLSIITVIVFRFGVIGWMLHYIVINYSNFHLFFTIVGLFANFFFLVFSFIVFLRLLQPFNTTNINANLRLKVHH